MFPHVCVKSTCFLFFNCWLKIYSFIIWKCPWVHGSWNLSEIYVLHQSLFYIVGVLSGWSEWTACNVPCGQGTQSRFRIVNGESIRSNHAYDRRQCNKTCDFGDVRSVNLKIWKETYPNLVNDLDSRLKFSTSFFLLI